MAANCTIKLNVDCSGMIRGIKKAKRAIMPNRRCRKSLFTGSMPRFRHYYIQHIARKLFRCMPPVITYGKSVLSEAVKAIE